MPALPLGGGDARLDHLGPLLDAGGDAFTGDGDGLSADVLEAGIQYGIGSDAPGACDTQDFDG